MRRARDLRDAQDRSAAEEVARTLVPKVITITAKAGAEGRLFGSVTSADIVEAVSRPRPGIVLDRRKLHLDDPIKTLGTHSVQVKLHTDVEFPVTSRSSEPARRLSRRARPRRFPGPARWSSARPWPAGLAALSTAAHRRWATIHNVLHRVAPLAIPNPHARR